MYRKCYELVHGATSPIIAGNLQADLSVDFTGFCSHGFKFQTLTSWPRKWIFQYWLMLCPIVNSICICFLKFQLNKGPCCGSDMFARLMLTANRIIDSSIDRHNLNIIHALVWVTRSSPTDCSLFTFPTAGCQCFTHYCVHKIWYYWTLFFSMDFKYRDITA